MNNTHYWANHAAILPHEALPRRSLCRPAKGTGWMTLGWLSSDKAAVTCPGCLERLAKHDR